MSSCRKIGGYFSLCMLLFALSGCTYFVEQKKRINYTTDDPFQKVFYGEYEKVWQAASRAISHYNLNFSDQKSGYIETAEIPYDKGWRSPTQGPVSPSGRRYKITIRVLRGQDSSQNPAVSVNVKKLVLNRVDFFSPEQSEPSDGLEEASILYRIQREFQIYRGIQKFQDKQNDQSGF